MQVYLVGGAVRDEHLGIPHRERDWCVVGAIPGELEAAGLPASRQGLPGVPAPETKEEYALARTERKTGPGYHGFDFDCSPEVTIEQDLERRDLTVNAIAKDADGNIIDPWGGLADIENRVLRHVSDAFVEDPVRILRVARFAARFSHLGFTIAGETMSLMHRMVENGEDRCSRAGSGLEGNRVRACQRQRSRVFRGIALTAVLSAFCSRRVDALFGVPQPERWHPEVDTGLHVMMVLDQAERLSTDLEVRFAALTHDLGKGNTPKNKLPSHPGHEMRGCTLIRSIVDRLPVPGACRDLALLVAEFHTHCHRALELRPKTILKVLEKTDAFRRPGRFERFLLACEADARGRAGLENRRYVQAGYFRGAFAAASAIDAAAIAKEHKDRKIPTAIRRARKAAIADFRKAHQVPP